MIITDHWHYEDAFGSIDFICESLPKDAMVKVSARGRLLTIPSQFSQFDYRLPPFCDATRTRLFVVESIKVDVAMNEPIEYQAVFRQSRPMPKEANDPISLAAQSLLPGVVG